MISRKRSDSQTENAIKRHFARAVADVPVPPFPTTGRRTGDTGQRRFGRVALVAEAALAAVLIAAVGVGSLSATRVNRPGTLGHTAEVVAREYRVGAAVEGFIMSVGATYQSYIENRSRQ